MRSMRELQLCASYGRIEAAWDSSGLPWDKHRGPAPWYQNWKKEQQEQEKSNIHHFLADVAIPRLQAGWQHWQYEVLVTNNIEWWQLKQGERERQKEI